jgi:hypothetical protein
MRRALLIIGVMVCLCSPAECQPKANEPAPSDITIADLRGLTIEATVFHQQVVTRNGGEPFPNRQRVDIKFSVTQEDKMEGSILSTAYIHGAAYKGTQSFSSRLERPGVGTNFGGGNGVWIFQDGMLTSLYVYKAGGAYKREFSFSRTSSGLACAIKESFARENGTGPIVWNSSVDGARMSIIRTTQTSATCKVTKK